MQVETLHFTPTREQMTLLAHAFEGHSLITAIGSENDILWGQMSDVGMMEATDLPLRGIPKLADVPLNAWRLTERGKEVLRAIADFGTLSSHKRQPEK